MPEVSTSSARYRVRRATTGPKHQTYFIAADGSTRAISGGAVATPDEAANEAALAILGHHVGGDLPRAWRLVDAFEREFLTGMGEEIEIDAAAVEAWIAAREQLPGR